jgi:hypothetical protein
MVSANTRPIRKEPALDATPVPFDCARLLASEFCGAGGTA